jgi:hypothetical protein
MVIAWITSKLRGLRRHAMELIAVLCWVALVIAVNPASLGGVFRRTGVSLLLLMLPVTLGAHLARGLAWWFTLRQLGVDVDIPHAVAVECAGQSMVLTPTGDLARARRRRRRSGPPLSRLQRHSHGRRRGRVPGSDPPRSSAHDGTRPGTPETASPATRLTVTRLRVAGRPLGRSVVGPCLCRGPRRRQLVLAGALQRSNRHAHLGHPVAFADRHRVVLQ